MSNPPFQNQLRSRTAMDRGLAALVRARAEGATSAYTDVAAVFLKLGLELTVEGGSVAMLLPQSVLASRDAAIVRACAGRQGKLKHLWVSGEQAFDRALVSACGVVIARSMGMGSWSLTRSVSVAFETIEGEELSREKLAGSATWAHLMAPARGLPSVTFERGGVVGDIAVATADFRDEYYALRGLIVDVPEGQTRAPRTAPVLTSGLIGLAESHWGQRATRIHKVRYGAPCIDLDRVSDPRVGKWLEKRLVPKILLATQTRAIEALVDEAGLLVPCLPVISVSTRDRRGDVWRVASALASPVCTLLASERHAGTALTSEAIKLAARDVLRLPLPVHVDAWELGAGAFRSLQADCDTFRRAGLLRSYGIAMCEAYGLSTLDTELLMGWWMARAMNLRKPRGRKKTAPA